MNDAGNCGPGRNEPLAAEWPEETIGNERASPIRILLADDDPAIRHMIADYLQGHRMHVVSAAGGDEMSRLLATGDIGLLILDLRLGDDDGLDLLREIRSRSDVPVIITTGHRRDEIDRVVGLELGADDYTVKPFSLRELLARIKAVLRRRDAGRAALHRQAQRGRYRFAGWELDRATRRLEGPCGPVPLTKGEYALLTAFLEAPQRPLTREYLL